MTTVDPAPSTADLLTASIAHAEITIATVDRILAQRLNSRANNRECPECGWPTEDRRSWIVCTHCNWGWLV